MRCSSCKTGTLLPTRIDDGTGPAGYQCNHCQGALLSLAPYLDWARGQASMAEPSAPAAFDGESVDSKAALAGPNCSRIMLRCNMLADKAHGLDYCFHCEEVWLDHGEWQYLKSQGLHTRINSIATEPYQRRLREQALRDAGLQRFRQNLGDAAFAQVQSFAQWLQTQEQADAILRYLKQETRR